MELAARLKAAPFQTFIAALSKRLAQRCATQNQALLNGATKVAPFPNRAFPKSYSKYG
jgi:hypothetical protein